MNTRTQTQHPSGFSLVQLLVSVAIIAIVSAIGFGTFVGGQKQAREQKLRSDVTTVNRAIMVYKTNGGLIPVGTDADTLIGKLKSRVADGQKDQVVGLTGSMIDSRLSAVYQDTTEAASGDLRAIWDTTKQRFVVANAGSGIKEFALTTESGDTTELRETSLEFASVDDWVWDFEDVDAARPVGPGDQPTDPTLTTPVPVPPSVSPLLPPAFTVAGGDFDLHTLPEFGEITNPNSPVDGQVMYATSPGNWYPYTGAFEIAPGMTVYSYVMSIDPDAYSDSSTIEVTYNANPVGLEIAVNFDKESYTYMELGGPLMPGTFTTPTLASPGLVTLTNAGDYPTRFLNSSVFDIRWTKDGSDPIASGGANLGAPFTGGFPGQPISLGIGDWAADATRMQLQVVAYSKQTNVAVSSAVEVNDFEIDVTTLRAPLMGSADGLVTLDFDTDFGDVPAGASIYYTVDGTDPGVTATGGSATGTLYTGPIQLEYGEELVARVYAPTVAQQWFTPSTSTNFAYVNPNVEVYVGGEFYLNQTGSTTHRNIARVAPDGSLDTSFDPGAGANPGSVVGVVRRTSGGVLVGGDFSNMDGTVRPGLVKMNPNGSVDSSSTPGSSRSSTHFRAFQNLST